MIDDDGDWAPDTHDVGADGCSDYFEDGFGGCNNFANPGAIDENNDNWSDCGADGVCNDQENGYSPIENPDPNNDDYDYNLNPFGTEGNGQFDFGERTENNGVPDIGEPNIDLFDLDESVPKTTEYMVVNATDNTQLDTVVSWSNKLDGDLGQFDGMVFVNETLKNSMNSNGQ